MVSYSAVMGKSQIKSHELKSNPNQFNQNQKSNQIRTLVKDKNSQFNELKFTKE